MNTLKKLSTVAFALFAFGVANAQEDGLIPVQSLPASVQTFINQNFSANNIGTEVEFRANGDWKEVKARNGAVPAKIVPAKISKYVHKNYPNVLIKEIQKERRKYEVSLSNGLDLDFNLNGKFLKIDD